MVRQVLVVDGDRNFVSSLSLLLEGAGLSVSQAHDAAAGLASLHAATPDVVVIDTALPDRDGLELAQCLRADPARDGLRLVMTSARARPVDLAKADALGVDAFFTKPFAPHELVRRLEAFS